MLGHAVVQRVKALSYERYKTLPPGDCFIMPVQLSDIEIQRSLGSLPGWSRRGNALVKQFVQPSFLEGIDWVRKVADVAEELDHHPDIDIRHTKITIGCSTHSAGGITEKDVELAQRIDAL